MNNYFILINKCHIIYIITISGVTEVIVIFILHNNDISLSSITQGKGYRATLFIHLGLKFASDPVLLINLKY